MENKLIEVIVTPLELVTEVEGPICAPMFIIDKLKKAGIPIDGILLFKGVKYGVLSETETPEGNILYQWRENPITV